MKKKLTVLTDASGKVLGTQAGHGDQRDAKSGILISLIAGEGQRLHKIEHEVPELHSPADIQKFHQQLAQHIKKGN
jgi:hypothetical protein